MVGQAAQSRFRSFALSYYEIDAVQELCLHLQDSKGADVPMLLWCVWLGVEGVRCDEPLMRGALQFSRTWRTERVNPLREIRISWRDSGDVQVEAARKHVAAAEQSIELIQMEALADLPNSAASGPDTSVGADSALAENLGLYAEIAGFDLIKEEMRVFAEAAAG